MISSIAILASSDIEVTLAYYEHVLGFESTWTWGSPPVFGSASSGGATITFNLQPELASRVRGHQHGFKVENPDELYHVHRGNGAHVVSEIETTSWGSREYILEDPDGYHLRFWGQPGDEIRKSDPLPKGLELEARKPTVSEYASVAEAVLAHKRQEPGLLENTWSGVVARSPEGTAVGILRIMWDAPGWFSIWDLAVLPEWQARHVGSTMLKKALEMIRTESPGGAVYLFTYKDGFYERFGFTKETVSMRRL